MGEQTEICPNCHKHFKTPQGCSSWCEHCNWNVEATNADGTEPRNPWAALSRHQGEALHCRMCALPDEDLLPNGSTAINARSPSLIYLIYMSFLCSMIALALWLLWQFWVNPIIDLIAMSMLAVAWKLRPQLTELPSATLDRQEFPALFKLVDQVSDALNAPRVAFVIVDDHFNASIYQAGKRHEVVLTIGLPLWITLSAQQRVALLAHELSHIICEDPSRSWRYRATDTALSAWIEMFDNKSTDGYSIIGRLFFAPLTLMLGLLRHWMARSAFVDSQIAEYRADYLAARVSGTKAIVGLLETFRFEAAMEAFLREKSSTSNSVEDPLIVQLSSFLENLPAEEDRRLLLCLLRGDAAIDASHPATRLRLAFLQSHSVEQPIVGSDAEIDAEILNELRPSLFPLSGRLYERAHGLEI